MLVLVIEVSTEKGVIALVRDGSVVFERKLTSSYLHSKYLVPSIDEALKSESVKPKDLAFIVVGAGPGSYTGIRVGAAAAKTLSYASKVPLIGIPSLCTFLPQDNGVFAAVIDAKISGLYVQFGIRSGDNVSYDGQPFVCPLEEMTTHLEEVPTLVTPNITTLQTKIGGSWNLEESSPDPLHMYLQGKEKLSMNEYTIDGHLDLIYLRKTWKLGKK